MEKKETPEVFTNDKNDIGSPLSTGGRHGADHQLKGNEDHKTKVTSPDDPSAAKPPVKPKQDEQSFNGNNLPDANETPKI